MANLKNKAKTKCPIGHPYDSVNTLIRKDGSRVCRECNRIQHRRWLQERVNVLKENGQYTPRPTRPPHIPSFENGGPKKWGDPIKARKHARDSYWRCREKRRQNNRDYYLANREKQMLRQRKYYGENREKLLAAEVERRKSDGVRDRINAWAREHYRKNPQVKLRTALRARIRQMTKGVKWAKVSSVDLVGCSIKDFKALIEHQFKRGMTWNNYGKWHLDHIIPCAKFDLTQEAEVRKCFNFRNYQPLWKKHNLSKGSKIEKPSQIPLGLNLTRQEQHVLP
jgi:hypothetical protein